MTVQAAQPLASSEIRVESRGGRTRRAAMTWVAGVAYSITTVLVGLLATPILLRLLGADRIGAARAVSEWMGYLLLADLGLGSAFAVMLIRARDQGETQTAAMAKFALATFASIALIVVPLGFALAWFMPALLKVDAKLIGELRVAAMAAAVALVLLPMSIFRIVLETHQRGYLVNASLLVQSLLITSLSLLLAWRGWGIPGLTIATALGGFAFVSLNAWWAIRLLGTSFRAARRARVPPRQLISLCWPLAAAGAGNRVNLMTDAIVVGYLLGAGPVAVLFLTQRVILLAASQVNALGSATWAPLAELLACGDVKTFESRLAQLARLVVGCGVVLVGTVAAYNAHFVQLWVGRPMYGGDLLSALTAAAVVTFGFVCLFTWVIDMRGDTRRRLLVSSIGAVLNLALSIALVKQIGLAGVALGTLLAYLLTDAWYAPTLVCRRYGVRGGAIARALARALAAGLPWAAGAWVLARRDTAPAGWVGFALEVAIVGTLSLAYCWFAILTRDERADWRERLILFPLSRYAGRRSG